MFKIWFATKWTYTETELFRVNKNQKKEKTSRLVGFSILIFWLLRSLLLFFTLTAHSRHTSFCRQKMLINLMSACIIS